MEIKCFESVIWFIVHVCKISWKSSWIVDSWNKSCRACWRLDVRVASLVSFVRKIARPHVRVASRLWMTNFFFSPHKHNCILELHTFDTLVVSGFCVCVRLDAADLYISICILTYCMRGTIVFFFQNWTARSIQVLSFPATRCQYDWVHLHGIDKLVQGVCPSVSYRKEALTGFRCAKLLTQRAKLTC